MAGVRPVWGHDDQNGGPVTGAVQPGGVDGQPVPADGAQPDGGRRVPWPAPAWPAAAAAASRGTGSSHELGQSLSGICASQRSAASFTEVTEPAASSMTTPCPSAGRGSRACPASSARRSPSATCGAILVTMSRSCWENPAAPASWCRGDEPYEPGRAHSRALPVQPGLTLCKCGKSKPRTAALGKSVRHRATWPRDRGRKDSSWSAASSRPQRREVAATPAVTALRATPARTCVRILR
jgi:hypothetical protein